MRSLLILFLKNIDEQKPDQKKLLRSAATSVIEPLEEHIFFVDSIIFFEKYCYYCYLNINRVHAQAVRHNRTNIWNSTLLYYATLNHLYYIYTACKCDIFRRSVDSIERTTIYTSLFDWVELNCSYRYMFICIASNII